MITKLSKNKCRVKRHKRNMKQLKGIASKPRVSIFRSLKHLYVQVVDDSAGKTIFSCGTITKDFVEANGELKPNIAAAEKLGKFVGEQCKKNNIEKIVFDRNGYLYHGRVKAIAEGIRAEGIAF